MNVLEVNDLGFSYGAKTVLKNFSLELSSGEICGLSGPSGCGKSTLLHLISGFTKPQVGSIHLNGSEISNPHKVTPPEKRQMGLIFQELALFPHMSVKANILFGLKSLSRSDKEQRLSEMLSLGQLEDLTDRMPHELSGGQKQRVALARALAPKPAMLLMDEPFTGLDLSLSENIMAEMKAILQKANITTLMVSHSPKELEMMCDRQVFL